jgi:hypothetical protein
LLESTCLEFLQEHALPGWKYRVDFFLPPINTVVEIDSVYWHGTQKARAQDARKTAALTARGYRVLRLPDTPFRTLGTEDARTYLSVAIQAAEDGVIPAEIIGGYPLDLFLPEGQEGMGCGSRH